MSLTFENFVNEMLFLEPAESCSLDTSSVVEGQSGSVIVKGKREVFSLRLESGSLGARLMLSTEAPG